MYEGAFGGRARPWAGGSRGEAAGAPGAWGGQLRAVSSPTPCGDAASRPEMYEGAFGESARPWAGSSRGEAAGAPGAWAGSSHGEAAGAPGAWAQNVPIRPMEARSRSTRSVGTMLNAARLIGTWSRARTLASRVMAVAIPRAPPGIATRPQNSPLSPQMIAIAPYPRTMGRPIRSARLANARPGFP